MSEKNWKDELAGDIREAWGHEIDIFEGQIELKRQGKLDDKVFAETRLRRGAYGQRYDNGKRHDGVASQDLAFPSDGKTKGVDTVWDAPGMMRIKIPWGGMTLEQMVVLADLAEEYSDNILHITTRQDIQLHFIHIDDTPDLMRRLAAVGITTREACGNSVRNVTACPCAGVCQTEAFDVTPYADALTFYFLGHPDVQDFGRKFKIAFSGCEGKACGLANMHDMGFIGKMKDIDGVQTPVFDMWVGGGLGAVPHMAKLLAGDVPVHEILPLTQAACRVYARLGEKKNRNRARIKFLVAKLGIEEFQRLVEEELKIMPQDERWVMDIDKAVEGWADNPLENSVSLTSSVETEEGYEAWLATNVEAQKQPGFSLVHITLPLGDITPNQFRGLIDIAADYVGDQVRTTVEQNLVLRWVKNVDLPAVYKRLKAIDLGAADAGTILDITSCPGTDTCKLGIAASRGLAGELGQHLAAKNASLDEAVKGLKIKVSGCFNSCGQHHLADLGFYGNSRKFDGYTVPHFQVVLGGEWENNAGSYGMAMGSVPSKRVPDLVDAITDKYIADREGNESFQDFIQRWGKREIRTFLKPFMSIPTHQENPDFYTDWGDPREFTIGDMGVGECAGEVVTLFAFEIAKAESEYFESTISLDEKNWEDAYNRAYNAMIMAARALIRTEFIDVAKDADSVVTEFKTRFYDTEIFFDQYAKGKFAQYLFRHYKETAANPTEDNAREIIEEAQLFIEAVHACDQRQARIRSNAAAEAEAAAKG